MSRPARFSLLICGLTAASTCGSIAFAGQADASQAILAGPAPTALDRDRAEGPAAARSSDAIRSARATSAATRAAVPSPDSKVPTPFVSRITASSSPIRDSSGNVWRPRPATFGTWNRSSNLAGTDIKGTSDDAPYQHTGWGLKWYRLPVPVKGKYKVRLLMAENYWTRPGQRVFDVNAEGKPVARNVDIVRAVGRGAAHEVSFTVGVGDGQLDLDFIARHDTAAVSAIEVTSLAPVPSVRVKTPAPLVPLASTSFFYDDISKAPLAPNSAAAAARLAAEVKDNYNGVAAFNAFDFNVSLARATATTPRTTVQFWDCQKKGYVPRGLYDGAKHFVDVPIPASAVPATGTDGELTVYDPTSDTVWEFWRARQDPATKVWSACWGGRIDKVSTSQGIFDKSFGVSAAGLLMAPGAISLADYTKGEINHAMYLAVIAPARWDRISWPANRSDGYSGSSDALMEGQRLRLDPTLDVATLKLTPVGEMIARAAQKHGFVVADKAGAVSVITESGNVRAKLEGTNPWKYLMPGPSYEAMRNFPWHKMQVLPKDHGKPLG